MNTKVKIGIAIAIVTALIALIVLDQSTSGEQPPTPASPETSAEIPATPTFMPLNPAPVERAPLETASDPAPSPTSPPDNEFNLWREARNALEQRIDALPPIDDLLPPFKGTESIDEGKTIPQEPSPAADEYVVQPGDTYEGIARKQYGNGALWKTIAKANPDVKPYALRVGKKIAIPAKPAPVARNISVSPANPATLGGGKTHVVQPGDTLTGISQRYFNTIRHHQAIFEANRATVNSPDDLRVGMKIRIPDLDVRTPGVMATSTDTTPVPVNGTLYTVKEGDKLWTIAKRNRGQRGILDTIRAIVSANPGKLRSDTTPLRIGWKLVIPN